MREIKFRAWNVDDEIMLYSDFNAMGFYSLENAQEIAENTETVFMYHAYTGDKDFVLLQYTGLKDMDEKEIYEGDILYFVPYDSHGNNRIVKYKDGQFIGELIRSGFSKPLKDVYEGMKVIGNIYQNPELLPSPQELFYEEHSPKPTEFI